MAEYANYKCLRCGNEFTDDYSPDILVEKSCPKCKSNSIRRIKKSSNTKQSETSEKKK